MMTYICTFHQIERRNERMKRKKLYVSNILAVRKLHDFI